MSRIRIWSFPLLVLGLFALTAPRSRAEVQTAQFPNEEPTFKNLPDPEGSLIDLWKKRKATPPKPNINQEMLKSLLKQFGGIDPKNIDITALKNFIQANPLFQDRDRLNEFQDFFEEFLEKNPGGNPGQGPGNVQGPFPGQGANPFKNLDPDKLFEGLKKQQQLWEKQRPPIADQPGNLQGQFPQGIVPAPELPKPSGAEKQAQDFAKKLEGMFGDLDGLKDMAKGLAEFNAKAGGGFGDLPKWLPDMGKMNLGDLNDWGKKLGNMNLDLPKLDLGGMKFNGGFSGFGGGSNSSSGGSVSLGEGGTLGNLWILPLLIGIGIVAWLLIQKYRDMESKPRELIALPAPPIDPNDIRTRQDLVEAFDRLSLHKYGERARVWNHRVIGGQLEVAAAPKAAEELTGLYEQARYLPLHQELTEQQFSEARQHLRTLAEVGS